MIFYLSRVFDLAAVPAIPQSKNLVVTTFAGYDDSPSSRVFGLAAVPAMPQSWNLVVAIMELGGRISRFYMVPSWAIWLFSAVSGRHLSLLILAKSS